MYDNKKLPLEKIQLIVKLTKEGQMSRPQIAKTVGCSKATVWRYQKKYIENA